MNIVKSIIAFLLLAGAVFALGQGFIVAGWKGIAIVAVFLFFLVGMVKSIADTLAIPFRRRRDG